MDLLCLGLDVGPVEDPQELITNTVTVATAAKDPAPGNDADSTTVVVARALDSAQPFAGNTFVGRGLAAIHPGRPHRGRDGDVPGDLSRLDRGQAAGLTKPGVTRRVKGGPGRP